MVFVLIWIYFIFVIVYFNGWEDIVSCIIIVILIYVIIEVYVLIIIWDMYVFVIKGLWEDFVVWLIIV